MTETSIGPAEEPQAAAKRNTQPTSEGVDAQNANAFDMQHGLAGAEARPAAAPPKKTGRNASSLQPADDPNRADPNGRTDMISERHNPGQHGGGQHGPGRNKS